MANNRTLPLVSAIVPCHNAGTFVREAVESIIRQGYQNIQIIVVDDGSTDDSVDQLDGFADRISLIRQRNSGPASARNAGLRVAKGDYVAFLDADDAWHPRKIEVQLRHLLAHPACGIVYGRWLEWRCSADGGWTKPSWPQDDLDSPTTLQNESGWLYLKLLLESVIHTSSVMFRSDVIRKAGMFDETLRKGQDLDYWLRASRISPIHKLDSTLSLYRIYGASLTHRPMDTNYQAVIIERAVSNWGLQDTEGRTLDRANVDIVLRESWKAFGLRHLLAGSPQIAQSSARQAISIEPLDFQAWRLLMRAALRSLRSRL